MDVLFLRKSTHHSEDPKKHHTVSLRKALRRRLYLLGRTRLLELNHEVLGGLSILRCFYNQGKDQMLTTSRVKQKKPKRKSRRYSRSLVPSLFSTNKNKKVVKTKIYLPRVVYTAQRKPDKHSTNQESLSRQ